MRSASLALLFALAACASPPQADRAPIADERLAVFQRNFSAFVDRLRLDPHAPPGFVVVAVESERTLFEGAYGVRDLSAGAPMTLDTPVYNASVTKAYTGLLASVLDAEGVLGLNETLADVWPGLVLPQQIDAMGITVTELLSHQNEMFAGGLVFRSVATGEISAAETPAHLALYAVPRDPAFAYTNMGPFVVSAMMEARTGEPWRDLLQKRVLGPLSLSRTSARLEAWPEEEVSHCHTRFDGEWRTLPHRTTLTMNAAGGMYASGRDSARFVQAFLGEGSASSIPPDVLRRTWAPAAERSMDIWGLHRDGYGLGWDLGTYEGRRFVARSGGYAGCRATILFLPEADFGIAVLAAGDASANTFNSLIFKQALDYWLGVPDAAARAEERIASFSRDAAEEAARIDAEQAPWATRRALDARLVREGAGAYENARLGRALLSQGNDGLMLRIGAFRAEVRPAGEGYVVMQTDTLEAAHFEFVRSRSGEIEAIIFDDDRYERQR